MLFPYICVIQKIDANDQNYDTLHCELVITSLRSLPTAPVNMRFELEMNGQCR